MKHEFDAYIIIYLNLLLGAEYMLSCLEELEGTNVYQHSLKQAANRFKKELEKVTDGDLNEIWGVQDDTMFACMKSQEKILKELALMRPEEYEVILGIIKKYNTAPEAFQVWVGTKIVEKECQTSN